MSEAVALLLVFVSRVRCCVMGFQILSRSKINLMDKDLRYSFLVVKFVLLVVCLYVLFYKTEYVRLFIAANILSTIPVTLFRMDVAGYVNAVVAFLLSMWIFVVGERYGVNEFVAWAVAYAAWNIHFCWLIKINMAAGVSANLMPLLVFLAVAGRGDVEDGLFVWALVRLVSLLFMYMEVNLAQVL